MISILNKGGKDCSEDFDFHRSKGRALWKKYKIGQVVPCRGPRGPVVAPKARKPWLLGFW